MSAVFGIFHRNGQQVRQSMLDRMGRIMAYRGPDAGAVWFDGNIGMGQRMLHTTPESLRERLPHHDSLARLVISADARIDNRKELGHRLGIADRVAKGLPDSQVILHAYRKWGVDCPRYLLGDFSFAIWDATERQLFCATDTFGIRPLCYYADRDRFVFASDLAGLLPGVLVPAEINESRLVAQFLSRFGNIDHDTTLYRDLLLLPAGHALRICGKTIRRWRYWDAEEVPDVRLGKDAEYAEQLRDLLRDAVASRLRCDRGTALLLSGGIDSASVAAFAGESRQDPGGGLLGFSAVSPAGESCLESDLVRRNMALLDRPGIELLPEVVPVLKDRLLRTVRQSDYPGAVFSVMLMCLFETVARHGQRVILTGMEGDTVLGLGTSYLTALLRAGRPFRALTEARRYRANTLDGAGSLRQLLLPALKTAILPMALRRKIGPLKHRILDYTYQEDDLPLRKSFAEAVGLEVLWERARKHAGFSLSCDPGVRHRQVFNLPLIGRMYFGMDMLSSPYGVELRHPYLDRRLVEFVLGLPWEQKNRDGWEKWILRKATQGLVSDPVRWRRRREHVGWRFNMEWLRLVDEQLDALVRDRDSAVFRYLDYDRTQSLYRRYRAGDYGATLSRMQSLYGVEHWLRIQDERRVLVWGEH